MKFLLPYLRSDAEDLVDKGDLVRHVIPIDMFDLSLAEHGHRSIPLKGASSYLERAEAQTQLDQAFDAAMVRLNPVVEILGRSGSASSLRTSSCFGSSTAGG